MSNQLSATLGAALTVPGAPTLDSAGAGDGSVTLGWSAPASNGGAAITAYKLYRGTSTGTEIPLTTLGNVTGYTDASAVNGTTYFYEVDATNSVGDSALSNERSATPAAAATAPGAPTLDSAAPGNGSVTLAWHAPASNGGTAITAYNVYRGLTSSTETLLTTVGNVTGYTDAAAANGTTYFYKVAATNTVGTGAQSNERSATPTAPATVPGAPTLGSATGGPGNVTLAWSQPASNGGSALTGFSIYRSTVSGGETLVAALGTGTSHVESGVSGATAR